ncbi:MAG: cytochrome P450, partial [Actinomycetota bacterium]
QRALVAADPTLWPNAVEELLRWDPPVFAVVRRVGEAIDLGDQQLPAGALVSIELAAANRDPRRWDDPWELRLDRSDPRPLAFGFGTHHCLGHALARLELTIALRAIVERFGAFTIDTDRTVWRRSALLRGPAELYLTPG